MTTNIDWRPIAELNTKDLREDANFLLWLPNLRVSGPGVICYWQNGGWTVTLTGLLLTDYSPQPPTHFALIEGPVES